MQQVHARRVPALRRDGPGNRGGPLPLLGPRGGPVLTRGGRVVTGGGCFGGVEGDGGGEGAVVEVREQHFVEVLRGVRL